MPTIQAISRINLKGLNVELFATGMASRMCQCDRRTFKAWVDKLKIKPTAVIDANNTPVYTRENVERIAKAIKEAKGKR